MAELGYNANNRNRTSYAMRRMGNSSTNDLEMALRAFEVTAFNFSMRLIPDAQVRAEYQKNIKSVSRRYMVAIDVGKMTPQQAANEVHNLRNGIMEAARGRSSDLGHAFAKNMKKNGLTLEILLEKHAQQIGKKPFAQLSQSHQGQVYRKIVESGGKARPGVNSIAVWSSRFGRALFIASIGIAVYNIAVAEDKTHAAGKEGATLSGGFVGGAAVGAAAGLVCGPGSPVCVTIGIFVGGLLGAYGGDALFEWAAK